MSCFSTGTAITKTKLTRDNTAKNISVDGCMVLAKAIEPRLKFLEKNKEKRKRNRPSRETMTRGVKTKSLPWASRWRTQERQPGPERDKFTSTVTAKFVTKTKKEISSAKRERKVGSFHFTWSRVSYFHETFNRRQPRVDQKQQNILCHSIYTPWTVDRNKITHRP